MPANNQTMTGAQALNKIKHTIEAYRARLTGIPALYPFRESQTSLLLEMEQALAEYRQLKSPKSLVIIQQNMTALVRDLIQAEEDMSIDAITMAESKSGLEVIESLKKSPEYETLEDISGLADIALSSNRRLVYVRNALKDALSDIENEDYQDEKQYLIKEIDIIINDSKTDAEKYKKIATLLLDHYRELQHESLGNALAMAIKKILTQKSKGAFEPVQDAARLYVSDFINDVRQVVIGQTEFWHQHHDPEGIKKLISILEKDNLNDIQKWEKLCHAARKNSKGSSKSLLRSLSTSFSQKSLTPDTQHLFRAIAKGDKEGVERFFEQKIKPHALQANTNRRLD